MTKKALKSTQEMYNSAMDLLTAIVQIAPGVDEEDADTIAELLFMAGYQEGLRDQEPKKP